MIKECKMRGKDIDLGGVIYHECCHKNRWVFLFCENAIKANKCPEEE